MNQVEACLVVWFIGRMFVVFILFFWSLLFVYVCDYVSYGWLLCNIGSICRVHQDLHSTQFILFQIPINYAEIGSGLWRLHVAVTKAEE